MKDLRVLSINNEETYDWILNRHYAKRIPNIMYAFGLYDGSELLGIITYGSPPSPWLCVGICGEDYKDKVIELNRLCLLNNKKNYASFLISHSLKLLPRPMIVVSYADTSMNHNGYVYQATNFFYTGLTIKRTDVDTGVKHSRHCAKFDRAMRKDRPQKHRYVYILGTKKDKKNILQKLNYPILNYPKQESKYYEIDYVPRTQGILF
jgi:hypothetical protein